MEGEPVGPQRLPGAAMHKRMSTDSSIDAQPLAGAADFPAGPGPRARRLGQYLTIDRPALDGVLARLDALRDVARPRLGQALVEAGAVSRDALFAALIAQRKDRLRGCPLFAHLPDAELTRVAHEVEEVSAAPGECIIRQGERGDCFYVLAGGRALIYGRYEGDDEDEESPLACAEPGETIGEMGYFSDGMRSASARALEPTELLRFPYADLPECFRLCPTFATGFLGLVTRRLREANVRYHSTRRRRFAAETTLRHLAEYLSQAEYLDLRRGIEGLIDRVVRTASRLLSADRASLFLLDPATGDLWSMVAEGEETREIRVRAGAGVVGWVAQHGQIVQIPDAYQDARFDPASDQRTGYRTRSILCGPVRNLQGEVIGVIQVMNKHKGAFDEGDELLFKAFSHQAAIAVENLNLYQRVVENGEKMALMLDVATSLSQTLDLGSLIRRIVTKISEILECGQSSLFLLDRETDELWSMQAHGSGLKEIRFPAGRGLAGHAARTGEVVNVADAYEDPRFNADFDRASGLRTRSVLCMPVFDRDGLVIGVTQAINKGGGESFAEEDVAFLRAISAQIAVALENAQLYRRTVSMRNYLQSVQESISAGILTLDNDWRVITINKAAVALLGVGPGGCSRCDLRQILGGEKNAPLVGLIGKVYGTHKSTVAYNLDVFWPGGGGGRAGAVDVNVLPLTDHEGERQGLVLVLDDITYEKQVKSALTRYIPEDVVEKMLSDPQRQGLGGVCGRATVLFSDIRGFSQISEGMTANQTMDFLNGYFAVMVDEVLQQQGVLDKFLGDGMMAVFGVPYPRPGDATRAARAAVRMKASLARFNAARAAAGQPPVRMGVGVNTGEVISGNIGTQKRMDFTVLGDTVNIASRLESLNKQYDTEVLITDSTLEECDPDAFVLRPVDRVIVKGRSRPVDVYEVLGERGYTLTPAQAHSVCGVEAYRRRAFAEALDCFRRGADADGLCRAFLARCEHLIQHPPAADWDGVWRAVAK